MFANFTKPAAGAASASIGRATALSNLPAHRRLLGEESGLERRPKRQLTVYSPAQQNVFSLALSPSKISVKVSCKG